MLSCMFWWLSLPDDTCDYIMSCVVCAQSHTPCTLPAGKLKLNLPVPHRPWTHIATDFIRDLPASEGNTVIMEAVDRFSKMCRLIPFPPLPTALETAEAILLERDLCIGGGVEMDRLESPTRTLTLEAPKGVEVNAGVGEFRVSCRKDLTLESSEGELAVSVSDTERLTFSS
ncbi:hypothetical protein P4O66_012421 [Electrophorus voltai]|uniref:Integrase zinc-binding domain-containing protein n=1 Tax=Electrophorus voltai TaxID=2609070 RepID=A0AAD9DTS6_9TELE|nr:hypothetical protein P4O66_012421 [Electrophorus voltai]